MPREGGLLLQWQDAGLGDDLWKYQIFLMAIDDTSYFYQVRRDRRIGVSRYAG